LEIVGKAENLLVAAAALYWKYKTEPYFEYQAKGLPVLPVRYEHLVSEPRATLEQICDHLGLAWQDALLAHHEVEHTEILEGGVAVGNTDPKKAISQESVAQWDRFLTASDLATIENITGELCDSWDRLTSSAVRSDPSR
jgi:Sulfotransferase family